MFELLKNAPSFSSFLSLILGGDMDVRCDVALLLSKVSSLNFTTLGLYSSSPRRLRVDTILVF